MAIGFLTNKEAQEQIAALNERVIARGGTPFECPKFFTNTEARNAIAGLEAQLESLPAAKPPPLPPTEEQLAAENARRLAAIEATTARLEAAKKEREAKDARETAKAAAAALTPHLNKFLSLSGAEQTAFYRVHGDKIRGENQLAQVIAANPEASVSRDAATGIVSINHRKN